MRLAISDVEIFLAFPADMLRAWRALDRDRSIIGKFPKAAAEGSRCLQAPVSQNRQTVVSMGKARFLMS